MGDEFVCPGNRGDMPAVRFNGLDPTQQIFPVEPAVTFHIVVAFYLIAVIFTGNNSVDDHFPIFVHGSKDDISYFQGMG